MGDEHDSWLGGLGVDVSGIVSSVTEPVASAAEAVQSAASSAYDSASGAASSALDSANTAGQAVMSAESAAWDGTKSAYTAVTGAYDSVAPNFKKANEDLGSLVDKGEELAKEGNEKLVAQYGDVPVLGSVAKASAAVSNAMIDATGGVIKGAGDLASMAGNAIFHPIDAAVSMGEGAISMAEHLPVGPPGLSTTVKGIHGLVDLASGKEDGEYGSSVGELAENLLLNTKQDPDDPSKKTNADLDFAASIGGGTKVWKEKPFEAAARTITNLAPMLMGDEAAGQSEPPPEGTPPTLRSPTTLQGEPIPPGAEPPSAPPSSEPPSTPVPDDPYVDTQRAPENAPPTRRSPVLDDPYADTQRAPFKASAKTVDLEKTQAEVPGKAPPIEDDPANPQPDGGGTRDRIRQELIEATRVYQATSPASIDATEQFVRYRANKPNPGREWKGDASKWNQATDSRLHRQMLDAQKANEPAAARLKAAQDAAKKAGLIL